MNLAARHVEVLDGAAALIRAAWAPAEPDELVRDYATEEALATLAGRKLFVFGPENGANTVERASRGDVTNAFKVCVHGFEKFADPGRPTKEWIDRRQAFVDQVYTALDTIVPGAYLLGALWCQGLEVIDRADAEAVEQRKLWFFEIQGEYREIVSG